MILTTIAFRRYPDKIVVAADSQLSWGTVKLKCRKIVELPDGSVLGLCGDGVLSNKIQEWWLNECEGDAPVKESKEDVEEDDPTCSGLLLKVDGTAHILLKGVNPIEILDEFGAIGSGSDHARAFMSSGMDPGDAIRQASKFDLYTNDDIYEVVIPTEKDDEQEEVEEDS